MEHRKYESEIVLIDDAQRTITTKDNFEMPKAKKSKHKKKNSKTKEYKKWESDNKSEVIVIDDHEPITEEKLKKPKIKNHKRKVKLGKDCKNDMETLYITQKLKVKKTKFCCVININNVGKKKKKRRPSSIIRFARNECKREAYYNRIVPICMRKNCFADNFGRNCCRAAARRESYRTKKAELLFPTKKIEVLSPVSLSPLTLSDSINISYEDISDNSFSSEEELDTLIKRTKEREHQFTFSMKAYSEPFHSNPIPTNEDVVSTYSGTSLHSIATLVLPPLETEAYSPITSPSYMCNGSVPYSPSVTPDLITIDTISKVMGRPYSPSDPTNTLIINEDEKPQEEAYILTSPLHVKIEVDHENTNNDSDIVDCMQMRRDIKKEVNGTDHLIKIEDIKREEESLIEDCLNNGQIFETEMNINNNIIVKSEKIKRENENACDVNDNFKVFVKIEKS